MTRPFSQTMQASRLDPHDVWLVLLFGSIFLAFEWLSWATTGSLVTYDTSTNIQPIATPVSNEDTSNSNKIERHFEAYFPLTARKRLVLAQKATVFMDGPQGPLAIPATLAGLYDDPVNQRLRVILRAQVLPGKTDPFEQHTVKQVRIAVGTRSPLDVWLPEVAPNSKAPSRVRPWMP